MSTKVFADCPVCAKVSYPIDTGIRYEEDRLTFVVAVWRYSCSGCGWIWANDLQRKHNAEAFRRAKRDARYGLYFN